MAYIEARLLVSECYLIFQQGAGRLIFWNFRPKAIMSDDLGFSALLIIVTEAVTGFLGVGILIE